ncbi:MAG: hypothetical protein ACREE2_15985 [Stellaceae bacterium]
MSQTRIAAVASLVGCVLLAGAAAAGVPAKTGEITAEQLDIGRLQIHIERYGEALGVVATLIRPLGAEIECNGICYLPSSTRATSWRCAPQEQCTLHCEVSPPVGGCN